ncbi:MAG: ATP-binding protein [Allosphingosinicella sp.]|uniref:PAS domain-containing hybrid sensor histidine kinase/response regulator n=1 Tax=Allosphingosinicella sp. TaxID=2823234 RepID=UPI00393E17B8
MPGRAPGPGHAPPRGEAETLWDEAPCGYVAAGPDGTILRANRTFARLTGFAREELEGRRFQTLLTVAGQIYHETHFAPLLRMQGEVREIAFDMVKADGSRLPTLVNAVQRREADGAPASNLFTIFDASERRRYERELLAARDAAAAAAAELQRLNGGLEARVATEVEERLRAEDALRQAQKMEAIGQLTGGVAHDFNNLLTVIIGNLDSMARLLDGMEETNETRRVRRLRDMAHLGADRAATLTSRLLAFSRRQPLDPKPIDANRLIAGLSDMLHRTLGEEVKLETVAAAGLWTAQADPTELESAIVNLAVNARDAMLARDPNGGGRLTIETGNASLDDAYVDGLVEPMPPGQYVMVAVSDTGTGMDAATLERVFEPFFTTKEAGRGTGLGLSQVYGFVRQSGGHVRIYSEPGIGTTVKLYLPRLARAAAEAEATPAAAPVDGGDETILVVEDHDELRDYSAGVLRELGYKVIEARDGAEAIAVLSGGKRVDLLFTDVVLPGGMNGREVADRAARLRPGLKLLFTTGYTRNAIVHNGKLDPGVALITKPFTFDRLAAKVRQVLDG